MGGNLVLSGTSLAAAVTPTALSDWTARSTALGVVQAIKPNSTTLVNQYRKTEVDGSQSNVVYDPLDGIIGDGCCKINVFAGTGSSSGDLMIPLNPAWSGSQGPGSQDYYIQFRCKLGPNRLIPAKGDQTGGAHGEFLNCSGGFKLCIIGGYNFTSPGSTSSDTDNELVVTNPGWLQIPVIYNHSSGQNVQRFQEAAGGFSTTQQPARDRGISFTGDARYCVYHGPTDPTSAVSAGCWFFNENEWFTVYIHFKYNTPGGSTGNRLELYVARDGETSYTKLFDESDFLWASGVGDPNDAPNGPRGLHLLPYDSHRTSSTADTWHKYDEIIVSTQPIACPQVASTNTLPLWAQGRSDKVWFTPTDNATANAAGTSWIGGSAVIDSLAASNAGSTGGHHSVIDDFNGTTADQIRNELILPANGGHSGYYGNEVYVLPLRNNVLQWSRVTNADLHEGSSGTVVAWSNGRPAPSHTYNMNFAVNGVVYEMGKGPVPYLGDSANGRVFTFSRDTNTWTDKGNLITSSTPSGGNQISFYDAKNDQIIVIIGANVSPGIRVFRRSDLALVTTYNVSLNDGGELTGAFDTTNRILLVRGNGSAAGTTGYFWAKADSPTAWNTITPTGTGVPYKDGFQWHWPSKAFIGFVEGTGLCKMTPTVNASGNYTGLVWTTIAGVSGPTPPTINKAGGSGGYNRFQIFEDLGNGRSYVVYQPAYTDPGPHVLQLPIAGV